MEKIPQNKLDEETAFLWSIYKTENPESITITDLSSTIKETRILSIKAYCSCINCKIVKPVYEAEINKSEVLGYCLCTDF